MALLACFGRRSAVAPLGNQPPVVHPGLLDEILNALQDAIVVRDAAGAVVFENCAHRRFTTSPAGSFFPTQHVMLGPDVVLDVFAPAATSRAPLQAVLDSLPNVVYTVKGRGKDMKQTFTLNRHFQHFTTHICRRHAGFDRDAVRDNVDAATFERSSAAWAHAMATGGIYEQEMKMPLESDIQRWYLSRAVPVTFDADGGSSDYVGTVTDIQDQKRAQETQLQQLNERKLFEAVLEQLPIAVCIARPADGRIIFANARADAYLPHPDSSQKRLPKGGAAGTVAQLPLVVGGSQRKDSLKGSKTRAAAGSPDGSQLASSSFSSSLWGWRRAASSGAETPVIMSRHGSIGDAALSPVLEGTGNGTRANSAAMAEGAELHKTSALSPPSPPRVYLPGSSPRRSVVLPALASVTSFRVFRQESDLFSHVVARALREEGANSFDEDILLRRRPPKLGGGNSLGQDGAISCVESYHSQADAPTARTVEQPEGIMSVRVSCKRVLDSAGAPQAVVVVAEDTTLQRQQEEERLQRASQAVRSAFGNMSHELRTPLNAVLGFAELLMMITQQGDAPAAPPSPTAAAGDTRLGVIESARSKELLLQCSEYARGIQESGKLLLRVINDILDYMRSESGNMQLERVPFHIRSCVQLVQDMMMHQAQKRSVVLRVTVDDAVPPLLLGDSVRVTQLLVNLISNAIKFTSVDGLVSCRVCVIPAAPQGRDSSLAIHHTPVTGGSSDEELPSPDAKTDHTAVSSTSRLRVEVRDTGIGIAPSVLPRLFQPFSQADASTTRQFGGTGLGLSICKQLVGLMGGNIGVASVQGEGSTFWFELPIVPLPSDDGSRSSMPGAATSAANSHASLSLADAGPAPDPALVRILLAEDNHVNVLVCTRILKHLGYSDVTVVTDGEQAVRAVVEAASPFAVCLMDVQMPVCDGLEATRRIRALSDPAQSSLPIVALSAGVLEHDVAECLRAGMQAHVAKPVVARLLTAEIRRWGRPVVMASVSP